MGQIYCKRYMRTAIAMTGRREAVFTRLRCKEWKCDACAKINAAEWRNHLSSRLPDVSDTWYLVTLTANGETRGHIESFESIRDNIDRLIKRVKRVFGDVEYARVYEKHPQSEAIHAHMIVSGLTPYVQNGYSVKHQAMAIGVLNRRSRWGCWAVKTWFKKVCPQCGMGFQIDVQKVPVEIAVRYLTKYMTKSLQNLNIRNLRHVQVTRGIGSPENAGNDLLWETMAYITAYSTPPGTVVTDVNTGKTIDNNFWEVKNFYPDED